METLLEKDDDLALIILEGVSQMDRTGGHARANHLVESLAWLPDEGALTGWTRCLFSGNPYTDPYTDCI